MTRPVGSKKMSANGTPSPVTERLGGCVEVPFACDGWRVTLACELSGVAMAEAEAEGTTASRSTTTTQMVSMRRP